MKHLIIFSLLSALVLSSNAFAGKKETAAEFVERIQAEQLAIAEEIWAAFWVRQNFITKDTAVLAAKAGERSLEFESRMVCGNPTLQPRLTAVPVRAAFPRAPKEGSIYEIQKAMGQRSFATAK